MNVSNGNRQQSKLKQTRTRSTGRDRDPAFGRLAVYDVREGQPELDDRWRGLGVGIVHGFDPRIEVLSALLERAHNRLRARSQ